MEIISLTNHIVRKALLLSLNEMAVLCDIKNMSKNPKFGYQCIKSKDKIADWLDLSRGTVFNALATLETKGYIERTQIGLKLTQFIHDLDSCQEEIGIYIETNNVSMISKKVGQLLDPQYKNCTPIVQKLDGDSTKIVLEQSKICTQDNNIDKNIKEIKIDIQTIPTEDEFISYYKTELEKEFPNRLFAVKAKFETWIDDGWKDGNGNKIKNWKLKLKNTITHLKPVPANFENKDTSTKLAFKDGKSHN
jgi:GTP-sensing pleiotropic transcriptional regulator CodY